jgi:hypothetical protein
MPFRVAPERVHESHFRSLYNVSQTHYRKKKEKKAKKNKKEVAAPAAAAAADAFGDFGAGEGWVTFD